MLPGLSLTDFNDFPTHHAPESRLPNYLILPYSCFLKAFLEVLLLSLDSYTNSEDCWQIGAKLETVFVLSLFFFSPLFLSFFETSLLQKN